jgi:hypothetical protein
MLQFPFEFVLYSYILFYFPFCGAIRFNLHFSFAFPGGGLLIHSTQKFWATFTKCEVVYSRFRLCAALGLLWACIARFLNVLPRLFNQ